jgi:hypothetical protein
MLIKSLTIIALQKETTRSEEKNARTKLKTENN